MQMSRVPLQCCDKGLLEGVKQLSCVEADEGNGENEQNQWHCIKRSKLSEKLFNKSVLENRI